jgi:hypothetical protein
MTRLVANPTMFVAKFFDRNQARFCKLGSRVVGRKHLKQLRAQARQRYAKLLKSTDPISDGLLPIAKLRIDPIWYPESRYKISAIFYAS